MTVCGFTPAEIDEMTFFDIQALFAYWREFPPAHEVLKIVHGLAPASQMTNDARDPSGIGGLIARFPNGKVRTS